MYMDEFTKKTEKVLPFLIVLILVIFLVGIGLLMITRNRAPKVDSTKYQAVFLEGNTQFYGHLNGIDTQFPELTDVYYIESKPASDNASQELTLVKFGMHPNEVIGPEDTVYLNRDKILYWENLKADSRVVKGILQEKAQRANIGTQQPAAQSTQPSSTEKTKSQ